MKIRTKIVKSKSGLQYKLEFNDRKEQVKVTCLSVTCAVSFLKKEIHNAMDPLYLKIDHEGIDDITYICPSYKKQKVIRRIKES